MTLADRYFRLELYGWRGAFYPKNLARTRRLEYARSQLDTIALATFFASGVLRLQEKLGPIQKARHRSMPNVIERIEVGVERKAARCQIG